MKIPLNKLNNNETAKIVEIHDGFGIRHKLEAMGLIVGKTIKKVSTQAFRGPVTISINGREIAIGQGISRRIIVEKT